MLKHATISRTNRAQQTLQLQRQWEQQQQQLKTSPNHEEDAVLDSAGSVSPASFICDPSSSLQQHISPSYSLLPSAASTLSLRGLQAPANSPLSLSPQATCYQAQSNGTLMRSRQQQNCHSNSMIKVFAQSLSQEVEYITLHVNNQTKSNQIVTSLLRKFRLKHRDPNLFYLTLERWIRKDGLKFKSVMLLGDEACPLQLQQCCSNPPHNDIKFTLQMRAGALVKIFCSDIVPDARYKCLSLSTHTTVEETIELMLHCLNIVGTPSSANASTISEHHHHHENHPRLSGSPSSTGSSASSNSSSSGIESDPNSNQHHHHDPTRAADRLDSESLASSVTSISSVSNISNVSTSIIDQYCMFIECKGTSFKRMLDPDEYLVDVYQNLLSETKGQQFEQERRASGPSSPNLVVHSNNNNSSSNLAEPIQSDQWFFIKLTKRDDYSQMPMISFTNPRQNVPLPPIPLSLTQQFNNINEPQQIVSTTQIEVNGRRSSSSLATTSSGEMCVDNSITQATSMANNPKTTIANGPIRQPPPPPFILLPPVRPRRRNLSNASSTFGRPLNSNNSRRRYDPAQLAEDLNRLNVKEQGFNSLPVTTGEGESCE